MRAIALLFGLLGVAGCSDGGGGEPPSARDIAHATDAGTEAEAEPTQPEAAPPDPEACDWFVYWLTTVSQPTPCNWGMVSRDTTVALLRTHGGECLAPATICGIEACSDLTFVRENQVVEIWGPAGLTPDAVWAATEPYLCE